MPDRKAKGKIMRVMGLTRSGRPRTILALRTVLSFTLLCLLQPLCSLTIRAAQSLECTHVLWSSVLVDIGPTIRIEEIKNAVAPTTYVFSSMVDGRAVLISRLGTPADRMGGDFFNDSDKRHSRHVIIHKMEAWRRDEAIYTRIDVKLPRAAACPNQEYMLIVYARADQEASRIASSMRPQEPYPCSWVP